MGFASQLSVSATTCTAVSGIAPRNRSKDEPRQRSSHCVRALCPKVTCLLRHVARRCIADRLPPSANNRRAATSGTSKTSHEDVAALSASVRSDELGSRTSISLATALTPRRRRGLLGDHFFRWESASPVSVTTPSLSATPISLGWRRGSYFSSAKRRPESRRRCVCRSRLPSVK